MALTSDDALRVYNVEAPEAAEQLLQLQLQTRK